MKILFVCPTSKGINALPLPPLGMLWIAAYVRKNGHEVDAIDTYIDPNEELLIDRIKWSDIVGITCPSSHQFEDAKRIGDLCKKYNKPTLFGGIHATVLPEESAKHFDIVIRGEGENTVLEILNKGSWGDIDGITYKCGDEIINNPDRKFIGDLDSIPFPARDLIPPNRYPYRRLKRFDGRYTSILGGRGCPNKCIFCASPAMWRYARLRKAEYIFKEMMEIYNNWGIKNIHFHDDTFTLDRKRVIKLCDLIIESGIDFKWSCITRPDKVDKELLEKMKAGGCVQIEIGAESASDKLLRIANKQYTSTQVKEAFRLANEADLTTYGYFLIGLPGETLFTWMKTILFAKSLNLDSSVFTVLSPFPGTKAYEDEMVTILERDCWLYKRPVIRVGILGPRMLSCMRKIADVLVNGPGYHGAYIRRQEF